MAACLSLEHTCDAALAFAASAARSRLASNASRMTRLCLSRARRRKKERVVRARTSEARMAGQTRRRVGPSEGKKTFLFAFLHPLPSYLYLYKSFSPLSLSLSLSVLSVLQSIVQLRPPLRPDESNSRPRQLRASLLLRLEKKRRRPAGSDAKQVADLAHTLFRLFSGIDPQGSVPVIERRGDAVSL